MVSAQVLSPSVAEKLVSEIKPMMRRGDYDGGTLHLATRISEVLSSLVLQPIFFLSLSLCE